MHKLSLSLKWKDPAGVIPQQEIQHGILFSQMPKAEEEVEKASPWIFQHLSMKNSGGFGNPSERRKKKGKKRIKESDNTAVKLADAECNIYCKSTRQIKANVFNR